MQWAGHVMTSADTCNARSVHRKRDMVEREIALHVQHYKTSGAALILGTGRFVVPKTLKVLVGGSDDRILGFTMLGPEAGEVIATVQTAMLADLPYSRLRDAILAHPTMVEGLGEFFARVPLRSVHEVTPHSTVLTP